MGIVAFRTSREIWVMPVPDTQYTVMYETYPSLCWKEATESVVANVRREKNLFWEVQGRAKMEKVFYLLFSSICRPLFACKKCAASEAGPASFDK